MPFDCLTPSPDADYILKQMLGLLRAPQDWCKGLFSLPHGSDEVRSRWRGVQARCLYGALHEADRMLSGRRGWPPERRLGYQPVTGQVVSLRTLEASQVHHLLNRLAEQRMLQSFGEGTAIHYNDADTTTFADIINLLQEARGMITPD